MATDRSRRRRYRRRRRSRGEGGASRQRCRRQTSLKRYRCTRQVSSGQTSLIGSAVCASVADRSTRSHAAARAVPGVA
eukprot:72805-Rhodomonas_salina.2